MAYRGAVPPRASVLRSPVPSESASTRRVLLPEAARSHGEEDHASRRKDSRPAMVHLTVLRIDPGQRLRRPPVCRDTHESPAPRAEHDRAIDGPARAPHLGRVTDRERRATGHGDLLQQPVVGEEPHPLAVRRAKAQTFCFGAR